MINAVSALKVFVLSVALLGLQPPGPAPDVPVTRPRPDQQPAAESLPFGVGEVLDYDIKVAFARGNARLEILNLEPVKGRQAFHAQFTLHGGIIGFRVNEKYDTWVDVTNISTLQYREDVRDSFYERRRNYEFFPATRRFTDGVDTAATVERPVDQASIFYLIRTLDLRVGLDTNLNNYFQMDRNPVRIEVIGRERITVDAGEFDALVVHPVIKAKGLFAEGGDAKVWISDDDRRIVLQIKAKVPGLPKGTLTLALKSYRPPTTRLVR
jgi:hypothetical protein